MSSKGSARSHSQTYKKAIELKAVGSDETGAQNKARARLIILEAPAAPAQTAEAVQTPKTRAAGAWPSLSVTALISL